MLQSDDELEIVQAAHYRIHQCQVKNYKVRRAIWAEEAPHLDKPIGEFWIDDWPHRRRMCGGSIQFGDSRGREEIVSSR